MSVTIVWIKLLKPRPMIVFIDWAFMVISYSHEEKKKERKKTLIVPHFIHGCLCLCVLSLISIVFARHNSIMYNLNNAF